jgi:membrane fusion protein, macrolide-specific efflux system
MDTLSSKIRKLGIIAAIIAVAIFGAGRIQSQTTKGTTIKFNAKKDTIYTPRTGTIEDKLTLAASVGTDQIANLRFQNSGKLVWVGVKVGDAVKRGQAIASLDREQLRKNLATQFNNYRTQLSQFQDTQDTYKKTKEDFLVTDTIKRILERTQYSLDNSVINYEITDMAIKESVLVSPIAGVVVSVDQPLAGTNITPATATFVIINPNNLFFKAEIDQDTVTKVQTGQAATLTLDSFPDKNIDSKITYIAFTPVTGQTSTVYEIRFELPITDINPGYRLGMDGDANIILSKADNAMIIPTDAVNDDNGQNYVYLKSNNQLVRKDIKIGIQTDTDTQVLEGLSQNDQVVVIKK